jgi:hypothetical protein
MDTDPTPTDPAVESGTTDAEPAPAAPDVVLAEQPPQTEPLDPTPTPEPVEVVLEALTTALATFKAQVVDPLYAHVVELSAKVEGLLTARTGNATTGAAVVTPSGDDGIQWDVPTETAAIDEALGVDVPNGQNPPSV